MASDLKDVFGRNRAPDMEAQASGNLVFRERAAPSKRAPFSRQIFPPQTTKLPMSQDFNVNVWSGVLAAGAGSVVVPSSFTLPGGMVGYVQIMGLYIQSPTNLTDITFTLRINQGPVSGWANIQFPPGVANFVVQNFSDLQVRAPMSCTVDVLITNNSGAGPWTVGAKIAGWYHPELEEKRIYGEV